MPSPVYRRIGMIILFLAAVGVFGHRVIAKTAAPASAEDAIYVFLEQAFPVLGDDKTEWTDSVFSWTRNEDDTANQTVIYDIPVNTEDIFTGYPTDEISAEVTQPTTITNIKTLYPESIIQNFSYLQNLYSFDSGDVIRSPEDLNGQAFMEYDFTTDLSGEDPVVLLFHTHGSEGYADSKNGVMETAEYLAQILREKYGISVLHHTAIYDAEGINGAYERMSVGVSQVIAENPSIKIAIDIHRDGIGGDGRLVTTVNGKDTAQVMLVNGLCKVLDSNGVMQTAYIAQNPYLEENLAFSFRMKMASDTLYEGWMRNMYLKAYRYSTYMLPQSLLLEVGAEGNTLQEAKNAMEPFAEVLMTVLSGNG